MHESISSIKRQKQTQSLYVAPVIPFHHNMSVSSSPQFLVVAVPWRVSDWRVDPHLVYDLMEEVVHYIEYLIYMHGVM